MCKKLLLLVWLLPFVSFGGTDVLQLRCIPSPNLLKNVQFSKIDSKGRPESWVFDNCSKSPHFKSRIFRDSGVDVLEIDTPWQKFGYYLQKVAVQEGVSYYASVDVQSDNPVPAIWLRCMGKKNADGKVAEKLEYVIKAYLYHSEERKEVLKDFIDEKLISTLSADAWSRIGKEIQIPEKKQMKSLDFRIGICGGNAGKVRLSNPVFRKAEAVLEIKVSGKNWHSLTVKGARPSFKKLDSAKDMQLVSVKMPHAGRIYKVELKGVDGRIVTREVTNE